MEFKKFSVLSYTKRNLFIFRYDFGQAPTDLSKAVFQFGDYAVTEFSKLQKKESECEKNNQKNHIENNKSLLIESAVRKVLYLRFFITF